MSHNQGFTMEKRHDIRYPAHRSSILKQCDARFFTTIINFSASGVGFLSSQKLDIAEEVELVFEVDINNETIHYSIPILIVRVTPCEDQFEYSIGANLNKVTFEYRK